MSGSCFVLERSTIPIPVYRPSDHNPPARLAPCCSGPLLLLFLMTFLIGCARVRGARRRQQLRRRVLALLERARELGDDAVPGDIIAVEGRVIGGAVAETGNDGRGIYREQLYVEDAHGRRIDLGLPDHKEIPSGWYAGEVVFAVGELARPTEGARYRSTPIDALTAGRAQLLWTYGAERAAAMTELNVQFKHDGGAEGWIFIITGALMMLFISFLAFFVGPDP